MWTDLSDNLLTILIAVGGGVLGILAYLKDRSHDLADTAMGLIRPLQDQIVEKDACISRLTIQVASLSNCLAYHNLSLEGDCDH